MFTDSEVKTLITACARTTRVASLLALSIAVSAATAAAQGRSARRPETAQRLMVTTFQSGDRVLGLSAADALRTRLARDANPRDLYVVPKVDINNTLQSSGYAVDEALLPNDAKALAGLVRAEEYVDGVVTRTPTGVHVEARLVVARDNTVTQKLPAADAPKLDQAMAQVSRDLLEARRQVAVERECAGALRASDAARAIRTAEAALAQNPRYNNMIRVCLLNAYISRDTPRDSTPVVSPQTLAMAEATLATDPRNIQALKTAAIGYKNADNEDKYVQTLTALVAADPTDLNLQNQVVNELAASGRASLAAPIILDALQSNPGDPRMLRTAWLVLLAARDFERALTVGDELVRVDTAAASADYYRRVASAYKNLNRASDALRTLETGTARFPNDAALLALFSQTLREAGQAPRAAQVARRALAIDPTSSDARVQLVQAYVAANMADSAGIAIRAAAAAGVNRTLLSQLALKVGNDAYKAGQVSKARADFERAIRFLQLSNEMAVNVDAQFLLGAAAFSVGDAATREAQTSRSCALVQLAQSSFASARTNLAAGQARYPEPAAQLLAAIGQFTTPLSQMARAYCR